MNSSSSPSRIAPAPITARMKRQCRLSTALCTTLAYAFRPRAPKPPTVVEQPSDQNQETKA